MNSSRTRRIIIEDHTKAILVKAWQSGMRCATSHLVVKAAEDTGLSVDKVKKWIANHRASLKTTVPKKREVKRGVTGYNLFTSTLKGTDIEKFGCLWREMTDSDRMEWNERAAEFNDNEELPELSERQKKSWIHKCIKSIMHSCTLLDKLGVGVGGIAYHDGTCTVFGSQGVKPLFAGCEDLQRKVALFSSNQGVEVHTDDAIQDNEQNDSLKELRMRVQNLFNQKYSEAIGKPARMPYSRRDTLNMEGMPEGTKFGIPSSYGKNSCRRILDAAEHITVTIISDFREESVPEIITPDIPLYNIQDYMPPSVEIKEEPESENEESSEYECIADEDISFEAICVKEELSSGLKDHTDGSYHENDSLKELRLKVQYLFNQKYSEAIGKPARMPYSRRDTLNLEGMPEGIKFGIPSSYGKNGCRRILDAADHITVTIIR